jgi:hypothetical protein
MATHQSWRLMVPESSQRFRFQDIAEGPLGMDLYDKLAFAKQHPEGGSIFELLRNANDASQPERLDPLTRQSGEAGLNEIGVPCAKSTLNYFVMRMYMIGQWKLMGDSMSIFQPKV